MQFTENSHFRSRSLMSQSHPPVYRSIAKFSTQLLIVTCICAVFTNFTLLKTNITLVSHPRDVINPVLARDFIPFIKTEKKRREKLWRANHHFVAQLERGTKRASW